MRLIQILIVMSLSALFISCSQEKESEIQPAADSSSQTKEVGKANIRVDLLDASEFKSLIKRHQGKILFINTWATWCMPCKEEFPDLVKLAKDYQDSDVAIIGVSVDYPDEVETKIIPFLQNQQVNFPNFVQNFKRPEELINLFNEKWRGAVPATFIYDKTGRQRAFLLGKHKFEEFKSEIEKIRSDS